jgi:hypothetical protein
MTERGTLAETCLQKPPYTCGIRIYPIARFPDT